MITIPVCRRMVRHTHIVPSYPAGLAQWVNCTGTNRAPCPYCSEWFCAEHQQDHLDICPLRAEFDARMAKAGAA